MGGCTGVPVPALHAQRSFCSAACPSLVSAGCSRLAVSMRSVSMVGPILQRSHGIPTVLRAVQYGHGSWLCISMLGCDLSPTLE